MPKTTVTPVKVTVNTKTAKKSRSKRTHRKGMIRRNRVARKMIPMAYATRQRKPYFRRLKSMNNEQEIIVCGEDLIIPTPNTLPQGAAKTDVFLTIPANPLYWVGTRLSGLAAVYQQYRPLEFTVDYIPQVPVTVPGQVICGTLWNNGSPSQNLQQTLMSSNGGVMTQCFKPVTSRVICNRKTLPLNLYNVHDDLALNTSNPFIWVAHYSGTWQSTETPTSNQPGWVYVKWKYAFSVGLGNRGAAVQVYNETNDGDVDANLNIKAGWGVVLKTLKKVGVPILRKIGVVLVNEAIAFLSGLVLLGNEVRNEVRLPVGATYTISPEELLKPSGQEIKVRGSDGVEYYITDDTRACVYMTGEPVDSELNALGIEISNIEATLYTENVPDKLDMYVRGDFTPEDSTSVTVDLKNNATTVGFFTIKYEHNEYYYTMTSFFVSKTISTPLTSIESSFIFESQGIAGQRMGMKMQSTGGAPSFTWTPAQNQVAIGDLLTEIASLPSSNAFDLRATADENLGDRNIYPDISFGVKEQPNPPGIVYFDTKIQPDLKSAIQQMVKHETRLQLNVGRSKTPDPSTTINFHSRNQPPMPHSAAQQKVNAPAETHSPVRSRQPIGGTMAYRDDVISDSVEEDENQ